MNLETYIVQNWLSVLIYAIGLALVLWLLVSYWTKIAQFTREVWSELGKCTWPWDPQQTGFRRYKQLIDSTVVVIVSTILLAGYVTFSDFILVKVVSFLTRYRIS